MSRPRLLVILTVAIAFPALLLGGVLFILTDSVPVVTDVTEPDPQVLIESKHLLKRIRRNLKSSSPESVSLTHLQLANLMSYISHGFSSIRARYNVSGVNGMLALSVELPANPFGDYLNIVTEFTDGRDLYEGASTLGGISLSNRSFFNLVFFSMGMIASNGIVDTLKNLLQNATFSDQHFMLNLSKVDRTQLADRLKADLTAIRELAVDENQFDRVGDYYDFLHRFAVNTKGLEEISILDLLNVLFTRVQENSSAGSAADENADALLALGMTLGNYRLRTVIGEITGVESNKRPRLPKVLLAQRRDLTLHFIYSVVLQILGNSNISYALGELKEIGDMDRRGTGFSFTDLAADRAGVQFAILATDRSGGARRLQQVMAVAQQETEFFPPLHDLPDRLRLSTFSRQYRTTVSEEYKKMVVEIDRRIYQTSLYQGAGGETPSPR